VSCVVTPPDPLPASCIPRCSPPVDLLGWDYISIVDAIDKGLGIFWIQDFNTSKVFE
jgi:hypothetical protein